MRDGHARRQHHSKHEQADLKAEKVSELSKRDLTAMKADRVPRVGLRLEDISHVTILILDGTNHRPVFLKANYLFTFSSRLLEFLRKHLQTREKRIINSRDINHVKQMK